jgi:glycerophosphoryl diester phosphodiesterase
MTAFIRGGAQERVPRLLADTLLLAHRAGNDLERLRLAESAGADVVEADVHLHRGRLELRHVKRLRPLPLCFDRWYVTPAPARSLLLEDVLAASRAETRLLLDLKGVDGRLPRGVAAALARAGDEREVTVCSRTWRLLDRLPRDGSVRRVLSAGSERQLARLPRRARDVQADGVSVHARLLTPGRVRSLADVVPRILAWAVTTIDAVHELAAAGVNGFILDDLAVLRLAAAHRAAA